MPKITINLWYDKGAKEAAEFYASVFPGSKISGISTIEGTPSGTVDLVGLSMPGQELLLMSAGPLFKFNPSISFLVACKTSAEVDAIWKKISKNGSVLMELGEYPFSKRYGWAADKYGLSWQVMDFGKMEILQRVTPVLMFTGNVAGKAEEAINFYTSIFEGSKVGDIMRYGAGEGPDEKGTIKHASFRLGKHWFAGMDSAHPHGFSFNESISFIVHCKTQKEIDYYWERLSAVPEAEQCGWLKDKYGVSWQIVPTAMDEMMKTKDKEKLARLTEAFLKMKKFDIRALENAFGGK